MPRYPYQCPKCSKEFDVEKSMMEAERAETCPACGESGTRVFTAPALIGVMGGSPAGGEAAGGCASCCPGGTCGLN